jgi:SAM-dependent methyltransferase
MSGEDHSWLKGGGALDTESVRQHYDAWADDYDATLAQWNYRAPSEAAAMLKPLIPADAAILDFGAGTGLSGQAVRDAGFTGRLDASDVSPRSVEIARARGVYSDVRVVDGNALPLPYETDSYDAAISIGVLTYIAQVDALLRELARATAICWSPTARTLRATRTSPGWPNAWRRKASGRSSGSPIRSPTCPATRISRMRSG